MKKFVAVLSMFVYSFIISAIINGCGLEDIANINPPTDIDIAASNGYVAEETESGSSENLDNVFDNIADGWIRFKADNQEYERRNAQEYYLIVGYDIYYSFTSGSAFYKANVYDPFLTAEYGSDTAYHDANVQLYDMSTQIFPDGSQRFPNKYFGSIYNEFYSATTFPIPLEFVQYLDDRDYNVRFCFFDDSFNNEAGGKNPYINNNNVCLDNVFPNFSQYEKSWYKKLKDDETDKFIGFYDYRYYYKLGIPAAYKNGNINIYKMWFYIIAKGFNSADEVDRIPNYMESTKSATKEIYFAVDSNMDTDIVDK